MTERQTENIDTTHQDNITIITKHDLPIKEVLQGHFKKDPVS